MNNYCENCQCDNCLKQLKLIELQKQFEELKKQMDEISKSMELNCPSCGKSYVEPLPIYPYPQIPWSPIPYPVTPGWQWQWPTITTAGTVENDLDKVVINTFPPNWINDCGGSTII